MTRVIQRFAQGLKLVDEEHVDAIIGSSGSPNSMGVIQFAAESGTPMLAPVGAAAVVLPMTEQKKWVFKTTHNHDLIAHRPGSPSAL